MPSEDQKKNIVIIGGGIIGCTTAYFLTRHPSFDPAKHTITLLEASKIAGGASGKAGGLLGLWAYPSNIVPLSFRLHAELAAEHNGAERWGYRRLNVGQIDCKGRQLPDKTAPSSGASIKGLPADDETKARVSLKKRTKEALGLLRAAGLPEDLDWVSHDSVRSYDEMGNESNSGQVHPFHFTTSMAALAEEAGAKIVLGARVTSIDSLSSAVKSVTYASSSSSSPETTIPATHVVLAAGPWTSRLFPASRIGGLRAHSVTIRPSAPVSGYALFTSIDLPPNFSRTGETKNKQRSGYQTVTPEIYARPNNEIYACGEGDHLVPLPETTEDVVTDDSRCQDIVDYVGSISDELRDGEVTVRQACYLPVCEGDKGPFIGEVRDVKGLILGSGHSCWGIQNGPATGKLISEIVLDGKAMSAKLGKLDPKVAL